MNEADKVELLETERWPIALSERAPEYRVAENFDICVGADVGPGCDERPIAAGCTGHGCPQRLGMRQDAIIPFNEARTAPARVDEAKGVHAMDRFP